MPRFSIHTFISFPSRIINVEHELDIDTLKIQINCCTTFKEVNEHLALYFNVIQCELVHKNGIKITHPSQKIFEYLKTNQCSADFELKVNKFLNASL